MERRGEFKKFLNENKSLLGEEVTNYLLDENSEFQVRGGIGQLTIYLKNCSYFLDSEYLLPSMHDDCLYTITDRTLLSKIDIYIDRKFYLSDYSLQLKHIYWKEKRQEIISQRGGKCERCNNTENLQVHHKEYKRGKLAWEYGDEYLECLCGGCHMKHHKDEVENKKIKERTNFIESHSFSPEENKLILKLRAEIINSMDDNYITSLVNKLPVHNVLYNRIAFKCNRVNYFKYLTNLQKQVIDPISDYLWFDMKSLRKNYPCKK